MATVPYAGVNIAGLDFGTNTSGYSAAADADNPGQTGIDQMDHFVTNDGLNAFRLPVSWQFLVDDDLGGSLDSTNFGVYNDLVQGCISSGAAMCIIDVHNYARWDGGIIGQGGPTNAQFAALWSGIASNYVNNQQVVFAIMNEPHDLDLGTWSETVQEAVTAIRNTGSTSQMIFLPGTDYSSAGGFLPTGGGTALSNVTNLDGTTTNLIFDVHQYLDIDYSGTNATCVYNNTAVFEMLGNWLRTNDRKAMLTETGGGSDSSSCLSLLCEQFDTINSYDDVFLGWAGWAAGAFSTTYVLSETPTESNGVWTDQPLVTQCIAGKF